MVALSPSKVARARVAAAASWNFPRTLLERAVISLFQLVRDC